LDTHRVLFFRVHNEYYFLLNPLSHEKKNVPHSWSATPKVQVFLTRFSRAVGHSSGATFVLTMVLSHISPWLRVKEALSHFEDSWKQVGISVRLLARFFWFYGCPLPPPDIVGAWHYLYPRWDKLSQFRSPFGCGSLCLPSPKRTAFRSFSSLIACVQKRLKAPLIMSPLQAEL